MLLTKFESKSARVKGLSFHKKRPWILASLHSGIIQLWDYRIPTLLDRFDNHDGPVRGIHFHSEQPLFVSGGDDYKIKVWNYKMRKCLFTLLGHLDYVRTTFFHHEYPWILSASDDQTIRIWNWQSRHCISIIPGHNYYVMSAQFHPTEDLIISASLDQTVRIWDFSGLRKKSVYSGPESIQIQMQKPGGTPDLFGQADTVVRFSLEGHERGVNWATFHPNISLAASCGDDRQIKLWRMNESRAWELDTCRGHHNNVSCVLFHPTRDLLLSVSEDKTLKIWDLLRRICIHTVRRDSDRFWILAVHPTLNLFAAGHDGGFILFKLERERPSFAITSDGNILYVKDNSLRRLEVKTQVDTAVRPLRSIECCRIHSVSYNQAENTLIAVYKSLNKQDDSYYQIFKVTARNGADGREESSTSNAGLDAVWVSWNKFAVLTAKGKISIRNAKNEELLTIEEYPSCDQIFQSFDGTLLVKDPAHVYLHDIGAKTSSLVINARKVKHVVWSDDKAVMALLSAKGIKFARRDLEEICTINETARVKSGIFECQNEVFIYTTPTHVKYAMMSGSTGVLRTITFPMYILRAVDDQSFLCLDRNCVPQLLTMETTEYKFKLALEKKRFDEVVKIVRKCNLVGQSTIAYLYNKGYPEIALRFVDNKKTRYGLAVECGDVAAALAVARELDQSLLWDRLARASLQQGKISIAETAYQKLRQLDRLTTLYALTGNFDKLRKLSKIADVKGDSSVEYSLSLLTGDADKEVELLESSGQVLLAYFASIVNGKTQKADVLGKLFQSSINIEKLPTLPATSKHGPIKPLTPLHSLTSDFPLLAANLSFLDCLADAALGRETSEPGIAFKLDHLDEEVVGGKGWADDEFQADAVAKSDKDSDTLKSAGSVSEEDEGWQFEDFSAVTKGGERLEFVPVEEGESRLWLAKTQGACSISDCVELGRFQEAFLELQNQFGVINFAPFAEIFLDRYSRCRLSLKGVSRMLPSIVCYNISPYLDSEGYHADDMEVSSSDHSDIDRLTSVLQRAYRLTTSGKFSESIKAFREILLSLTLLPLGSRYQRQQAKQLASVCLNYILGQQMELARRALARSDPDNVARICELSLYFAHCNIQRGHKILALKTALNLCFKSKNYKTAMICGRLLLSLGPSDQVASQTKKVIETCEANGGTDSSKLDFDELNPFDICAASHTPIYRGNEVVRCPLSGACYLPKYKGEVCRITQATEIGRECVGLGA